MLIVHSIRKIFYLSMSIRISFRGKWKANKTKFRGKKLEDFSLFLSSLCQSHIHRKGIPWLLVMHIIIDLPLVRCLPVQWLFLLRTQAVILSPSSPYPVMTSDICYEVWWFLQFCLIVMYIFEQSWLHHGKGLQDSGLVITLALVLEVETISAAKKVKLNSGEIEFSTQKQC